jgi:hypothetical protein
LFILWLVLWMCVHPLLWLFFGFNIHKWNGFITCYSYHVIESSEIRKHCHKFFGEQDRHYRWPPLRSSLWTCLPISQHSTTFTCYILALNFCI